MNKKAAEQSENYIPVKIQTPDSIVWEGRADSISSENSAGPFDILPMHGNMITIIDGKPIEVASAGGTRKFTFEKAVITVRDGAVTIYANIGADGSSIERVR